MSVSIDTLEKAREEGRAPWTNVQVDTRDFVVFEDAYPVTAGHTLVVPKKIHKKNYSSVLSLLLKWAIKTFNLKIQILQAITLA